jgi:diaminopimelate epimerase
MSATPATHIKFEKWQALGNDYLIIERDQLPFELTSARVRKLCAPHFGVFADGVLSLSRSKDPEIVADLRIYNPDGSEAELSGNGAREAVLYLRRHGWTDRDSFAIHTAAGPIRPQITGLDTCRVDMGRASLTSPDFPGGPPDGLGELSASEAAGRAWSFQHVSIGNPQCAIHLADEAALEALDLPTLGPPIETHTSFPNRTNVSWYTEVDSDPAQPSGSSRIRARIFERGVGETLSSGTGATGAAIAHVLRGARIADARTGTVDTGAGTADTRAGTTDTGAGTADTRAGTTDTGAGTTDTRAGTADTRAGTTDTGAGTADTGAGSAGTADGSANKWPATVTVVLDGGELQVEVDEDLHVHLTGWARPVFAGELSDELYKELSETE